MEYDCISTVILWYVSVYKWKRFPAIRGVLHVWALRWLLYFHFVVVMACFPLLGDEILFSPPFPVSLLFEYNTRNTVLKRVRGDSKHGTDVGNRLIRISFHKKVERGTVNVYPREL